MTRRQPVLTAIDKPLEARSLVEGVTTCANLNLQILPKANIPVASPAPSQTLFAHQQLARVSCCFVSAVFSRKIPCLLQQPLPRVYHRETRPIGLVNCPLSTSYTTWCTGPR